MDRAWGAMVEPCCMNPPTGNHSEFPSEYWFTRRLHRPWEQGWGLYHSYGVSLEGQGNRSSGNELANGTISK